MLVVIGEQCDYMSLMMIVVKHNMYFASSVEITPTYLCARLMLNLTKGAVFLKHNSSNNISAHFIRLCIKDFRSNLPQ